ncbi:TPA: three component ABC system middle component [Vibrio diabolicus]
MPNAFDHIDAFHHNAYILAPVLERFFEFCEKRDNNILLSYLVLPLLLYPESRVKLKSANKNSSIYTIFSDQEILFGIGERVNALKFLTNTCLLLLVNNDSITISNNMSISHNSSNLDSSLCSDEILRAAKNLSILFNSHEIIEIYRKLGIKKL